MPHLLLDTLNQADIFPEPVIHYFVNIIAFFTRYFFYELGHIRVKIDGQIYFCIRMIKFPSYAF